MLYRPYCRDDRPALLALHQKHHGGMAAQNDPEGPLSAPTLVAYDGGRLVGAAGARHCLEGALVIDPTWGKPAEKLDVVRSLALTGALVAARMGLGEMFIFTDSRAFARRVARLPGAFVHGAYHVGLDLTVAGGVA
jgi:hypothetical protein